MPFWTAQPDVEWGDDGFPLADVTLEARSKAIPTSVCQSLVVRGRRDGEVGRLSILIRPLIGQAERSWRLQLDWKESISVAAFLNVQGQKPRRIDERTDLAFPADNAGVRVTVEVDDGALRIKSGSDVLLEAKDPGVAPSRLRFAIRGDGILLHELTLAGVDGGKPYRLRQHFVRRDEEPAPRPTGALIAVLGVMLLAWLFLWSLCEGRPTAAALLDAALDVGAFGALPGIAGWFGGSPLLPLPVAVASFVALTVGLFRLRHALIPADASAGSRWPRVALLLLVAVPSLLVIARERATVERELIDRDVKNAASVVDEAVDGGATTVTLGPTNALAIARRMRSFELRTTVSLSPGAILECRVRAHEERPQGVALLLSADTRVPTRFYHQSARSHRPIGTGSGAVSSGGAHELVVRVTERRFEALVDGEPVATARDPYFSAGRVVLLAARGEVKVDGYAVTPRERIASADVEVSSAVAAAVGPPVVAWILLALVAVVVGRARPLSALASFSFVLAPMAAGAHLLGDGAADASAAMATTAPVLLLLLTWLQSRGRLLGAPRFLLLLALMLAVAPVAVWRSLHREADGPGGRAAGHAGVGDTTFRDDLVYLYHPYARELNDYLTDHLFREQRARRAATKRVVSLGSSSTWGYRLEPDESYPARLQALLRKRDGLRDVEVLNAGWPGTIGPVLFRFLRDGLEALEPDVVTVSLYYNDSFALTQWDPEHYFASLADAGALRRFLATTRAEVELSQGRGRLNQALAAFAADRDVTSRDAWERCGFPIDASYPPNRFERTLRAFCDLAVERDFVLVLIQEPLSEDGRRIWKDEFYAVMDRLGEEFGERVTVVGPGPALAARGGRGLYQSGDEIHPTADGQREVAKLLVDPVAAALHRR